MPDGLLQFLGNRTLAQAVGTGVGIAAADAYGPALRPLAYQVERALTNRVLTPAELAELVIRGARTEGEAAPEAANSGVDVDRFHELTLLVGNPPGPQELIELWRREATDEAGFERGIRQGRFRTEWMDEFKAFKQALLAEGTLAEAAARDLGDGFDLAAEAARRGLSPERFELLARLGARPPATGQLFDLLNRGEINEGRTRQALRDLGIREEWTSDLLALRFVLPSPSDLVRFAVREVYTPAIAERFGLAEDFPPVFASEAARIGLSPELARQYWMAHWELPSAEQGFAMFHRFRPGTDQHIIGRPDLELLLRARDVMPFWRDRLIQLAFRVPGRIDLRRAFRAGVINRATLVRGYTELGYAPEWVERLARFAQREKMAAERDLTKAEWISLYEGGAVPREEALRGLDELGYDEREAGLILGLADAKRARRLRAQLVKVVRSRFLRRTIEADEARRRMTAAGVPAGEQEFNLELWELERAEEPEGEVRHISEAQMRAAWRRAIVNEERYRAHLTTLRIPAEEQEVLVALYRPAA